jgi:lactose/L-arabinose transport system substrate-binding protein
VKCEIGNYAVHSGDKLKKEETVVKRLFSMLLVVCVLFSIFGVTVMAGGKSGKITIWAWDPNFNVPVMAEAKARYQKINPSVEIEIVEMAKADVEQKLNTVLASGMKEGLPDIVLIEDYNAQKYLQAYPGAFADLTKKINHKEFASYKNELMTLKRKIYGVPFDSGVSALFYRRDILAEAGYEPADLNNITWDQFIEIGKQVKKKTGKAMIAFDAADGGLMRIMMQSAGEWYFDKNDNPNIVNNEVIKEGYIAYKKIVDSGIIKKTSGWNEWVASFNKGETASVITGCWIIGSIKAEKSQSGKWAAAPTPRLNLKSSVNYSNLGGSSWYVIEKSKNRAVAEDFLKTIFAADQDFYQKILVEQGAVGTYLPSQDGVAYTKPDQFFGGQKIFSDFSTWMRKIPPVNYGLFTYEADAALMAVMPDYLAGKIDVETALKKAEEQLKNQIDF